MTCKPERLHRGSCNKLHLPAVTSSAPLRSPLLTSAINAEQAHGKHWWNCKIWSDRKTKPQTSLIGSYDGWVCWQKSRWRVGKKKQKKTSSSVPHSLLWADLKLACKRDAIYFRPASFWSCICFWCPEPMITVLNRRPQTQIALFSADNGSVDCSC